MDNALQLTTEEDLKNDGIYAKRWNNQADEYNQWNELGLDEKVEWVQLCKTTHSPTLITKTAGEHSYTVVSEITNKYKPQKLLPCPFCGCTAIKVRTDPYKSWNSGVGFTPSCDSCGATIPEQPTRELMDLKWNKRL